MSYRVNSKKNSAENNNDWLIDGLTHLIVSNRKLNNHTAFIRAHSATKDTAILLNLLNTSVTKDTRFTKI